MRKFLITLTIAMLTACGGGGSSSGGGGGSPVAGQFDTFQITPRDHNLQLSVYVSPHGQTQLASASVRKGGTATIKLPPPPNRGAGNVGETYDVFVLAEGASHGEKVFFRICAGKNIHGSRIRKGQCTDNKSVEARQTLPPPRFIVIQDRH